MQTTKIYFAAKDSSFTDKVGQFVSTEIKCAMGYMPNKGAEMYKGHNLYEAEIAIENITKTIDFELGTWKDVKTLTGETYTNRWGQVCKSYSRCITTEEARIEWMEEGQKIVKMDNIQDIGCGKVKFEGITTNYWVSNPELLINVKQIA